MALDSLAKLPLGDLLQKHREDIVALRDRLGQEGPDDDQLLLRFLLQDHGNLDQAEAKAKEGRENREKYAQVLEKARIGERLPQEAKIMEHLCYGRWQYPDAQSENDLPPLLITRSGCSNVQALMASCTVEEVSEFLLWERRRCYDDVLRKSDETGTLILLIGVNDLTNASLITGREPKFFEAVKICSEVGSTLFPLLTRKHVMVNAGALINVLFRFAGLFMPQRVIDKVAFMTCEELFIAAGIPASSFPEFLGGSCSIPAGSPLAR